MLITETVTDVETADGLMAVLRKRPAGGAEAAAPRVVMFHDGPGVRRATHEFMAKLAADGFDVLTPDLYHRRWRLLGVEPEDLAASPSILGEMMVWLQSLTDDGIQSDMDAAMDAVGFTGRRVAAIGFCLGARAVHQMMTRLPDQVLAGAMWHPSFLVDDEPDSPHLSVDALQAPLFIGIGDADKIQSVAMHQRYLDAVAGSDHITVEIFAGADHGYTWPGYSTYDEVGSNRSYAAMVPMFRAALAS